LECFQVVYKVTGQTEPWESPFHGVDPAILENPPEEAQGDEAPEEANPDDKVPEEANPDEQAPEEANPDEQVPEEANPDEKVPEEANPDEKVPEGDPNEVPEEGDPNFSMVADEELEKVEIDLGENEWITNIEGRTYEYINSLMFEITKKYPNGSLRKEVKGRKKGSGTRFSVHGNLKLVGFFGNCDDDGVNRLGFYYNKEVYLNGQTKKYDTWPDAIKARQLSFYYLEYFGKPGFAPPKLVVAQDEESERKVNFLLDGLKGVLTDEEQEGGKAYKDFYEEILHIEFDKWESQLSFQLFNSDIKLPPDFNILDCEPNMEYELYKRGSEDNPDLKYWMDAIDYLTGVVEEKMGWDIVSTKMVWNIEEKHRAYYLKKEGKKNVSC